MKYKVGDKVKVVKVIDVVNEQTKSYIGKDAIITGCLKDGYTIDIDKGMFGWYEGELELIKDKEENPMINEEIIKDIAEVIKKHNLGVSVSEKDGKIIVEPLKVEEDLPINTFVMVCGNVNKKIDVTYFNLRRYAGNGHVYTLGESAANCVGTPSTWDIIIPFDKFNPNDIEESLKHNIVK